jgi:hypothetical protein
MSTTSTEKFNVAAFTTKLKEQDIQRTIIAWLELKRYFYWRNNVGAMVVPAKGNMNRRFIKFGTKGAPDIFVVRKVETVDLGMAGDTTTRSPRKFTETQIWGIECKRPSGSQSKDQRAFEARFTEAGGFYLIAKSLEDVSGVLG